MLSNTRPSWGLPSRFQVAEMRTPYWGNFGVWVAVEAFAGWGAAYDV